MCLLHSKQNGVSKIPLILAIFVVLVGIFFYFKVVPETITEQFVQPPAEVHAGESVKLIFNVSNKTGPSQD